MPVKFVKKHKILITVCVLLVLFVSFNLIRQRDVHQVAQNNTPTPEQVQQTIENKPEVTAGGGTTLANSILRQAIFINGAKAYTGQGKATIAIVDNKPVVQFGDDFKTSIGPDLQVYLSKNADPKSQGLGEYVSLGGLKSNEGAQIYNLPADHQAYASVLVWCRAFPSVFTQATF